MTRGRAKRQPAGFAHTEANQKLWELLLAWAEWRSLAGCPRAMSLPDNGVIMPPSTAPKQPGRMMELNEAIIRLDWDQRQYLVLLVSCQDEPWMKGKKWNRIFSALSLTAEDFGRLLNDAWRALMHKARRRGLV